MVVKQVPSKKGTGSFGGLAEYLLDKKNNMKKVKNFELSNCFFDDIDLDIEDIQKQQNMNQSAKSDKTLHLVVSFHEDEHPSNEMLADIEQELMKSIGMEDHQRLSVSHTNTNNFHLHIAANKIHPINYKLIDPSFSKKKLSKKAFELEEKYNLKTDQKEQLNQGLKEELGADLPKQKIKLKEGIQNVGREYTREQKLVAKLHKPTNRKDRGRFKTQPVNDMRKLSKCNLVFSRGSFKVLLQNYDDANMGIRRTNDSAMRRAGTSTNRNDAGRLKGSSKNERPATPTKNKSKDIEIHSGVQNFTSWVKSEVLDDIKEILSNDKSTFDNLQKVLAKSNLELKPKANGVVISDKHRNLHIKSSSIHRGLSKGNLEKRYGLLEFKSYEIEPERTFGPPKTNLWENYQQQSQERRDNKKELFKEAREQNTKDKESIKSKYENLVNKTKKDIFLLSSSKRAIYKSHYKNRKAEYQELTKEYKTKRDNINKGSNQITYKEYLMEKALDGDTKALAALRKTKAKISPADNAILGKEDNKIFISREKFITKQGLVVYMLGEDLGKIIDKGNHLKVTVSGDDRAIKEALDIAIGKYGKRLDINGDLAFKSKVLAVSEKYNLDITFKDKTMREIRSYPKIQKQQELFKKSIETHVLKLLKQDIDKLALMTNSREQNRLNTRIKKLVTLYNKSKTGASLFEGDLNTLGINKSITDRLEKEEISIKVDSFINNEQNKEGIHSMNTKVKEVLLKEVGEATTEKDKASKQERYDRFEKFEWVLNQTDQEGTPKVSDITVSYYRNRGVDIEESLQEHNLEIEKLDKKVPAIAYTEKNFKLLQKEFKARGTSPKEEGINVDNIQAYLEGKIEHETLSKFKSMKKVHESAKEYTMTKSKNIDPKHQKKESEKKGMER